MSVSFGTIEIPRSLESAVDNARLAESLGFDLLGVADSQSLYRDLYVTAGAVAASTSRIAVGPTVTNPVTRHPAAAAAAIGTVDEASGGRAIFGIGSGDSAILNLGERPARLAEMREYLLAMKDLLAGRNAEFKGNTIHTEWIPRPVPVYVAAEGPKTLELAGEVADGVICGMGLSDEVVELTLKHLGIGAQRSGRSLDDLDLWTIARVNVGSDRDALAAEIRMELASSAHHAFRFTLENKAIPPAFIERIKAVQGGYQARKHEALGESPNARLMADPEFLDYMVNRFAILGTTEQCAEQIRRVSTAGISKFLFTGFVADRPALLRTLGEKVLPACC